MRALKWITDFAAWRWAPTVGLIGAALATAALFTLVVPGEVGLPGLDAKFVPSGRVLRDSVNASAQASDNGLDFANRADFSSFSEEPSPAPARTMSPPAPRRGFSPPLPRVEPPPVPPPPPTVVEPPAPTSAPENPPTPSAAPPEPPAPGEAPAPTVAPEATATAEPEPLREAPAEPSREDPPAEPSREAP